MSGQKKMQACTSYKIPLCLNILLSVIEKGEEQVTLTPQPQLDLSLAKTTKSRRKVRYIQAHKTVSFSLSTSNNLINLLQLSV